jgi:hypothetical protein
MRVSDKVLKCAVFLGNVGSRGVFVPEATGFIVAKNTAEGAFQYVVTCQHCVVGKKLRIRSNLKAGGASVSAVEYADSDWYFHPDSHNRFVDVAVLPVTMPWDVWDVIPVTTTDFCDGATISGRDIGIGDELFYPGLFIHHSGQGRSLPVMRAGTLAAMPHEEITTRSGPIKAYLMEGRSIGGHSGSPVFVNFLAPRSYYADKLVRLPHPTQDQRYRLLGLVRGHLKAADSGEYIAEDTDKQDLWVNSGLATVIPASEILETLDQEDLETARQEAIAALARSADVPDAPANER